MAFTFFFRDLQVLEMAIEHILPQIAGRSRPKLWDAGCAMGPEVYTLAILLARRMGRFAFRNLRIEATDIDETGQFEPIVQAGEYGRDELQRMPAGVLEEYFEATADNRRMRLMDTVRNSVRFHRHDLLSCQEIDVGFSLVVCKNVLLHFSQEQRVAVIRMFHRALEPGGYFVTEHTQKLPGEVAELFEQVEAHAQLWRRREVAA
jgi:chemotaxis protein methyltransferase CheR